MTGSRDILTVMTGDSYPVLECVLKDRGVVRDLTNCAVFFDVFNSGTFLARRPGRINSTKSAGIVQMFMRGSETDWNNDPAELTVFPVLMVPYLNGAQAANILVNGGFDTFTGSSPSQLPTSWTLVGGQTSEIFAGGTTGPKPPVVYDSGSYWSVAPGATSVTNLEQSPSLSTVAGDFVTLGVWVRGTVLEATITPSTNTAVKLIFSGGTDGAETQFPSGEFDWRFITVEKKTTVAHTTAGAKLEYKGFVSGGVSGTLLFDEACLFKGRYKKLVMQPLRIKVGARRKPIKTTNILQGVGSFERDSNSNGVPDAWMHDNSGSGNPWGNVTASLDADPANVDHGLRSLKIVCAASNANARLFVVRRGKFLAGETYTFSIRYKIGGTASHQASITMFTQKYGIGRQQQGTVTGTGTTQASFATISSQVTLLNNTDEIECRIALGGITSGTFWFDNAQLVRA